MDKDIEERTKGQGHRRLGYNLVNYAFTYPSLSFIPTISEFFPIPILYAGKNPLLVDGRAIRSI
jgi:hypothetical protein